VFLPFSKVGLGRRGTFSSWVWVAGTYTRFPYLRVTWVLGLYYFFFFEGRTLLFDYHVFHAMNHDIITIINHMISILLA